MFSSPQRENLVAISIIFILFVCGCIFSFLYVKNDLSNLCGNKVFQEVYAPDNEYKATVFQRDCGATTGFSTQISILKGSAKLPNESGNIFAIDGHPDWTKIKVNWETNRSVLVRYSEGYKVFNKDNTIQIDSDTIKVKYISSSN